jgi:DNA-binding response OmpR family regulator
MSEESLALVIEDDYDASVIFAKALEVIGFKTEIISSGEKAVKRLSEVVPQMIVLDLHLPEVIGTDILKRIRADERLSETRVIVATADPRMADVIREQADLVLMKPTTFSQVRDFAARLSSAPRKKREEPKAEPAKAEEPKAEPAEAVEPKAEAATTDQPREELKTETATAVVPDSSSREGKIPPAPGMEVKDEPKPQAQAAPDSGSGDGKKPESE